MADKYQNKYRIASARAPWWNYGWNGAYFITICTHNPMLHENISRIIRWYKGRTTFESRKIRPGFAWQTRFYDHIIRNRTSEDNIRRYIWNNPARWKEDRFYL
jgi:hypothetical protein